MSDPRAPATRKPAPPDPVEVLLADGSSARVRAVLAEDAARLAAFHRTLSLETVHFRYFSGLTELPPLILRRFSQVDFARDTVLVAERGERMIALASYHRRAEETDSAEVAFVVADDQQGRGLGTLLLERLAELARERGITRFRADTLAGNRAMLRVFRDAGFELEREPDAAVVHVRFPIVETARSRAAHELREHLAEARSIARLAAPGALLLAGGRRGDAARLRELGFRGAIHDDGAPIPAGVDLALYSGLAAGVPSLVAACANAGVHALVLGELDGEPLGAERERFERELATAARRNGMRLLGPGSLGFANATSGVELCTLPVAHAPRRGALGLAFGSAGPELLERASAAGVGVSTVFSLGRRADVSANDLLQFWQDDPETRVVGLALASCGNPRKFERIAARLAASKPLVALATNDAAENARLSRAGAELARSATELIELAARRL